MTERELRCRSTETLGDRLRVTVCACEADRRQPVHYLIHSTDVNARYRTESIEFHHGTLEWGTRGVTNEVLLRIVLDRLQAFQRGDQPSRQNEAAIEAIEAALAALGERAADREAGMYATTAAPVQAADAGAPGS